MGSLKLTRAVQLRARGGGDSGGGSSGWGRWSGGGDSSCVKSRHFTGSGGGRLEGLASSVSGEGRRSLCELRSGGNTAQRNQKGIFLKFLFLCIFNSQAVGH